MSPLVKFVSRGDTTVVDAYLSPLLRRYVDRVADAIGTEDPETRLFFMQSSGGLTDATLFQGKDAILSGPAGGVVGAAMTAAEAGFAKVIGFDMGGTSTDVCHYDGEYEAELRDGNRRRAHARADDAYSHRRGGRWLDPPLRGRTLPGGTGLGGREPRPGLLPAWRTAHRHRRERDARQIAARSFPAGLRARTGRTAGRRSRAAGVSPTSRPALAADGRRKKWPKASSVSPSKTWRTRSRKSPSNAGTT